MSMSPGPWPLDAAMDARRRELRLRWKDVADRAGISYETLRTIRNGQYDGMRPLTESGIEQALRWAPGSVRSILSGGEPTPIQPEPPLTDEQQRLMGVYYFYVEKYGETEALVRIKRDVAEINAARSQNDRAAG